jgi:tetratricopeptide (TPR) repeat protein
MKGLLDKLWPGQSKSNDVEKHYQQGMLHHQQRQLEQAIAHFTKAIELNPAYAPAYNHRGLSYATQGKHDQAIDDFTQAIKLDPNHTGTYVTRAISYTRLGRFPEAIADFTKAIKNAPTYAAIYTHRGIAHSGQGNYAQALTDYNKALELEPNNAKAYYYRGNIYSERSLYAQAIADYTQAIKLEPGSIDPYYNRGFVYLRQGTYEPAFQDFTRCLQLIPDRPEYLMERQRITAILNQSDGEKKYWGVDGLQIMLKDAPFEAYEVVAQVPGLAPITFSCPCQAAVVEIGNHQCFVQGSKERILLDYFTPEVIDITIRWGSGSITESFRPIYQMIEPNGPGTIPQCKVGVVEIDIQKVKAR